MEIQITGNPFEPDYDKSLLKVGTRITEGPSWSFSGSEFGLMSEDEKQRVVENIKRLNLLSEI